MVGKMEIHVLYSDPVSALHSSCAFYALSEAGCIRSSDTWRHF